MLGSTVATSLRRGERLLAEYEVGVAIEIRQASPAEDTMISGVREVGHIAIAGDGVGPPDCGVGKILGQRD
jgi:hypothetical protein